MYDTERPRIEIQGHLFLKCHKNGEIQHSNDSDAMQCPLSFTYLSAAPIEHVISRHSHPVNLNLKRSVVMINLNLSIQ